MPTPKLPSKPKVFDPNDTNPCAGCSNCCEYVAVEVDAPTNLKDFNQMLWYLIHKDVWVYVDDENDWYLQFNTPCEKLENKRCGYYENRPIICREYMPVDCVRYADEGEEAEKFLFKNEKDFFAYLYQRRPKMFKKMENRIGVPLTQRELNAKTYYPNYTLLTSSK